MNAYDSRINRRNCLFALTSSLFISKTAPVFAQHQNADAQEVFAAFSGKAPNDYALTVKEKYGGDLLAQFNLQSVNLEVFLFRLADESVLTSFLNAEAAHPNIVQLGENQTFLTQAENTFSLRVNSLQYSLGLTKIDRIQQSNDGKGIRVAVIDSAVDRTHPSFNGNVIAAFDIIGTRPDIRPIRRLEAMRHGTGVAGVIAANGKLQGVAPKAELIAIEAFMPPNGKRRTNVSSSATIAHSIDAAINLDCDIINMSFGGPVDSLVELMIDEAIARNILVVAAGGNKSVNGKTPFPASHGKVIAVTSIDQTGAISKDAVVSSHTRLAAPGVDILTTAPKGGFQVVSGTSLSAPHVAGLAALARAQDFSLTPSEISALLFKTGDPVQSISGDYSVHVINGERFMREISS